MEASGLARVASAAAVAFFVAVAAGWAYLTVEYLTPSDDPHATVPADEVNVVMAVAGGLGVIVALTAAWTAFQYARTGRAGSGLRLGWLTAGMFALMLIWVVFGVFGASS